MKKIIIKITIIVLILSVNQSCFDGLNDISYQGAPLIEFSHLTHENAVWETVGSYWTVTITGNVDNESLQVTNIGPQQPVDSEIGYYVADQLYLDTYANKLKEVQPEHSDWELLETSAIEGVDYNFLDNGVVIIPANNSFGSISIELTPTDEVDLFIVLEERDLSPSDNYKFFRLRISPD